MTNPGKTGLWIVFASLCLQLAISALPNTALAQQVPSSTSPLLAPNGLAVEGETAKPGSPASHSQYGDYVRVLVKSVTPVTDGSNIATQSYRYEAEILDGSWKGKVVSFTQRPDMGPNALRPAAGDRLIAFAQPTPNSQDPTVIFEHHDRTPAYIFLTVLLFLVLLAIAGRRGITIAFSIFMGYASVIWVLAPLIMRGWSTATVLVITTIVYAVPTLWAQLGWNKKMIAAACSTLCGVTITYIVTELSASWMHLTGPANEMTLSFFDTYPLLNVRVLLVSGAIITALAVIQDVASAIASGVGEMKNQSPNADLKDLFSAGMRMGRDHLATMAPILLMASLGVTLAAWMVDLQTEAPWLHTLNAEAMAQSLILPLSGILGLALTVPASSICASLFWTRSFRQVDPLRRAVSWRSDVSDEPSE